MLEVEISLLTFDVGTSIARIKHLASNSQLFNTTIHIFIMHSIVTIFECRCFDGMQHINADCEFSSMVWKELDDRYSSTATV